MHPAFARTDHRPWQVPQRPWSMRQSWLDLLFAHWPVPRSVLRPHVPPELELQEFDGTSWIGLVPFRMQGVTARFMPSLPWLSAFPELNVRLYVEAEGKPGVWFLSLDATQPLAVWAARRFFHLPYFRAEMSLTVAASEVCYRSRRRDSELSFCGRYRPTGEAAESLPGSLAHFLTERYCLYAKAPDGTLLRNEVHHLPWPLQPAEAEFTENSMLAPYGLANALTPPVLHFAHRLDVVVWDADTCSPA